MYRQVSDMAADGLSVIAVAERTLAEEETDGPVADADGLFELCRGGLRIVGLLGFRTLPARKPRGLLALWPIGTSGSG